MVAGGGTALLRARAAVHKVVESLDGRRGHRCPLASQRALEAPARLIADNAGLEGAVVVQQVERETGSIGLNAATGEFDDLLKAGVIDPAKVTRAALQNAASIAGPAAHHRGARRRQARRRWLRCRCCGCRHAGGMGGMGGMGF